MTYACHSLPRDQWCDHGGPSGFMGHTCEAKANVIKEDTRVPDALASITEEFNRATRKFGSFNSGHEGFAVIREELDELWDAVKANDLPHACEEAKQVAAMALRFIHDLKQ